MTGQAGAPWHDPGPPSWSALPVGATLGQVARQCRGRTFASGGKFPAENPAKWTIVWVVVRGHLRNDGPYGKSGYS